MKIYTYKVVNEDLRTGQRGKRPKSLCRYADTLEVGGLYMNLGKGFPGAQRVLSVAVEEIPD